MTVVVTEQLCVKREMNEGLSVGPPTAASSGAERRLLDGDGPAREDLELGEINSRRD